MWPCEWFWIVVKPELKDERFSYDLKLKWNLSSGQIWNIIGWIDERPRVVFLAKSSAMTDFLVRHIFLYFRVWEAVFASRMTDCSWFTYIFVCGASAFTRFPTPCSTFSLILPFFTASMHESLLLSPDWWSHCSHTIAADPEGGFWNVRTFYYMIFYYVMVKTVQFPHYLRGIPVFWLKVSSFKYCSICCIHDHIVTVLAVILQYAFFVYSMVHIVHNPATDKFDVWLWTDANC